MVLSLSVMNRWICWLQASWGEPLPVRPQFSVIAPYRSETSWCNWFTTERSISCAWRGYLQLVKDPNINLIIFILASSSWSIRWPGFPGWPLTWPFSWFSLESLIHKIGCQLSEFTVLLATWYVMTIWSPLLIAQGFVLFWILGNFSMGSSWFQQLPGEKFQRKISEFFCRWCN